jgi:hypothetical protein
MSPTFRTPRLAALAIATVTLALAFGVNAVTHLVLLLRHDPLVREHRGTLQFLSAWIGDGVLLPVMNVIAAQVLRRTSGRPSRAEVAVAVAIGLLVTTIMHLVQGARGLVNWSMPQPWRWNALGWYHVVFMAGQLSYLALALGRVVRSWRSRQTLRDGAVILAGLALFAALLRWDYRAS